MSPVAPPALESGLAANHERIAADRRTAGVRGRFVMHDPGIPCAWRAHSATATRPPDLRRDRRLRTQRHLLRARTGGIRPDFLCLSKGISGGYLPLSVVLTTDQVYAAFYDDARRRAVSPALAFLHRQSRWLCRAALATLDIFAEDDVIGRTRRAATLERLLRPCADHHPGAGLPPPRHDPRLRRRRRRRVSAPLLPRGAGANVLLRPIGNTVT